MAAFDTLATIVTALVGLWAMLKLGLLGMYNYHLARLAPLSDEQKRQRLGGLLRIEMLEVQPAALIELLDDGEQVPFCPPQIRRRIGSTLAVATLLAISAEVTSSPVVQSDLLTAVAYPIIVSSGGVGLTVVHVVFTEARLWRSDAEQCESLYTTLSEMDNETFPASF